MKTTYKLREDLETLERWKAKAKEQKVSLAALIRRTMDDLCRAEVFKPVTPIAPGEPVDWTAMAKAAGLRPDEGIASLVPIPVKTPVIAPKIEPATNPKGEPIRSATVQSYRTCRCGKRLFGDAKCKCAD